MPIRTGFHRLAAVFLAAFFLLCFLGGCAAVNMHPAITEDAVAKPGTGLVVARVINLSSYPLPLNQLTVIPQTLNESKEVKPERLLAAEKLLDDSTVFASRLKPGKYSISSVRSFHMNGDIYYDFWVPAKVTLGTFDVQAGRTTDLGAIAYYPKSQGDKYLRLLARLPGAANGEVLQKYFPFQSYDVDTLLGWDDDGHDEDRYDQYLSILQNPVMYSNSYQGPSGSIYFLSKLGVILIRHADGSWALDAVDTNVALLSIAESSDGALAVSGSEGRIFYKPVGGEWRDLSLASNAWVDSIAFVGEDTLEAVARSTYEVRVERLDTRQPGNGWQVVNSFATNSGWEHGTSVKEPGEGARTRTPRRLSAVDLSTQGDASVVTISSLAGYENPVFANAERQSYGYDPVTWETVDADNPEVLWSRPSGAVVVGMPHRGFWDWGKRGIHRFDEKTGNWVAIKSYIRLCRDGSEASEKGYCENKQKARTKRFTFNSLPWYSDENNAIAVVTFTSTELWTGERSHDVKLLETTDAGNTWSISDKTLPSQYCGHVAGYLTDRILLSCRGNSGDFYESLDFGASWEHVRQHQDF